MTCSCDIPDWLCLVFILTTTPLWVPIYAAKKTYRCIKPEATDEEQEQKSYIAKRPRRLPYSRQFNPTTATLPDTSNVSSFLLRLPNPVRVQIYSYLFANRYAIHLKHVPKHIRHEHRLYPRRWPSTQHIRASASEMALTTDFIRTPWYNHLDLEILRTCRTVYQEAHHLVYSTNTFAIHNIDVLLYFNQTVRPQHLAMIKYLQVDWDTPFWPWSDQGNRRPYDAETWYRFWNIVATRLTGLKSLDLTLRIWPYEVEFEQRVLRSVGMVRGLEEFILDIKYPAAVGFDAEGFLDPQIVDMRRKLEKDVKKPRNKKIWNGRTFDGYDNREEERREEARMVLLEN